MKLSFTTLGCPDWKFTKILNEAQKMGYDGIEIRGIEGIMRAEQIPQLSSEHLEETQKQLSDHNLIITGFGTSVSFHEPAKYEEALTEGKNAIDVCKQADIPWIRIFGDKIADPVEPEKSIDLIAKGISDLCIYGDKKNIGVLMEIHGDFNNIENVSPIIERCGQYPSFGILWDIEHSDAYYGDEWFSFYKLIRPYIRNVHIKDHVHNGDKSFKLCLPGQGDIPIEQITMTLQKNGYDGFYALEWEKKWHPDLPDPAEAFPLYVELMRKYDISETERK